MIACSALKKTYRDMLRGSTHTDAQLDRSHSELETYFVYCGLLSQRATACRRQPSDTQCWPRPHTRNALSVKGSRKVLEDRMANRKGHFFAPKMLDSQLATLERWASCCGPDSCI